ncbi:ubiquitin-associated domain-containing protein 2 [Spea bombifrons]|uniref:ubiquitin-associated domain-containing protein 2 n=1 Tax=Spea bombifrons TaxID=233779 RepID=UPI00234BF0CE|nr:ubiquitin-associated domain-containing protein 2 [Spea bombifrons]
MIASTGSSGLYKAPLSKGLLFIPSALSILLAFLFQQQQALFIYNWQAIKEDFHIWRLISGRIICLDLKDTFCSSLLIYNFRTLERRFGSRKFTSFLLGAWILSTLFDFLLVEAVELVCHITLSTLPSGFLAPIFALFVPFYCSIPRVQLAHILGLFPITNKTLVYVVGLQLLTSSPYMVVVAASGLISGLCYNWDVLNIRQILCVPNWLANLFSQMLEPIFSSEEPVNETPVGMGATVDIQRQQRIELLDQQIMFSQIAQLGRRPQQQGRALTWNNFFQPWRNRHAANHAEPQAPPQPSEQQVTQLMEMGFSRSDVLTALRASNNDINVATNYLLQR